LDFKNRNPFIVYGLLSSEMRCRCQALTNKAMTEMDSE